MGSETGQSARFIPALPREAFSGDLVTKTTTYVGGPKPCDQHPPRSGPRWPPGCPFGLTAVNLLEHSLAYDGSVSLLYRYYS